MKLISTFTFQILALILVVLSTTEFVSACIKFIRDSSSVHPVEYYSPLIKILTLVSKNEVVDDDQVFSYANILSQQLLAITLILLHRKKGVHSSAILCSFWFLFTVGSLINYWTIVESIKDPVSFFD